MEKETLTLITPEDYARIEGVSLKTVYNRINDGRLNTIKRFKKTFIVK